VDEVAVLDDLDFSGYGLRAAKRFLRTAIVIDDEITIPVEDISPPLQAIVAPPFAEGSNNVGEAKEDQAQHKAPATAVAAVAIKPLADAFLDKQIICGVLKPVEADGAGDVVARAVKAALVADIVILDWYLKPGDNTLALSILNTILSGDRAQNGRLRLVIIYTSAAPLEERCDELKAYLEGQSFVCEKAESDLLILAHCRIRFVLKHDGKQGHQVEVLPELAIKEFAKHSNGLLSNFALQGIAALREATHHVLAVLDRKLDPAFVGHRMMIGDADDANEFAMSLFMLQMKSVLSQPNHLGSALDDKEVGAWFDDRFNIQDAEKKLAALGTKKADLRREMLAAGFKKKISPRYSALFLPEAERLGRSTTELAAVASHDFSRLATYIREFEGHQPLPIGWRPRLTLGTVVKLEGQTPRYLLCVQPACDTVRFEKSRFFPFIELEKSDKTVDYLVVRGGADPAVRGVNSGAGSRHYDEFEPDVVGQAVLASAKEADGKLTGWFFEGKSQSKYQWLGDVDPMKAQRIAVDLAGTLARVGLDEYEWLRRGGRA